MTGMADPHGHLSAKSTPAVRSYEAARNNPSWEVPSGLDRTTSPVFRCHGPTFVLSTYLAAQRKDPRTNSRKEGDLKLSLACPKKLVVAERMIETFTF